MQDGLKKQVCWRIHRTIVAKTDSSLAVVLSRFGSCTCPTARQSDPNLGHLNLLGPQGHAGALPGDSRFSVCFARCAEVMVRPLVSLLSAVQSNASTTTISSVWGEEAETGPSQLVEQASIGALKTFISQSWTNQKNQLNT